MTILSHDTVTPPESGEAARPSRRPEGRTERVVWVTRPSGAHQAPKLTERRGGGIPVGETHGKRLLQVPIPSLHPRVLEADAVSSTAANWVDFTMPCLTTLAAKPDVMMNNTIDARAEHPLSHLLPPTSRKKEGPRTWLPFRSIQTAISKP